MSGIAIVIALAFAALIATRVVVVVPRDGAYVVERLGRYRNTLAEGMHVLAPFIDRIAFRYSLGPKDQELSDVCITYDNIAVKVTSTFRWRVADPQRFAYSSADGVTFVTELVRTHQRRWIAAKALDEARETTREMERSVTASLAEPAREAGGEIVSVDVRAIVRA